MRADPKTAAEIRRILDEFSKSYGDRKSIEEILACFSRDEDVSVLGTRGSEVRRGIDQVRAQVEKDWAKPERYTREIVECDVSQAGDVAWAYALMRYINADDGPQRVDAARLTCVLERREGRWLIMHWHKSRPYGG